MSDYIERYLDLVSEAGMLKRVRRTGWDMLGAPYTESVAEHSFRCAVVGYILAKMEGADQSKVIVMTLFGDMPEARIGDIHKVANKYLNSRKSEREAYMDQIKGLEPSAKSELETGKNEYDAQKTLESLVARDADLLECLIQAKEYYDLGFKKAEKFMRKAPVLLKTKSAKALWRKAKNRDTDKWWEELSKFER
ncbi:MAG: HD domain-containing protein [Candidatus Omnitrophica bacterium]|nr:HD domain-containing protein [Candidatus Omnitrophota bacterium]